ncbi:MAG: hypothetical protein D6805_08980, partial [Planctomycetota bacterium]
EVFGGTEPFFKKVPGRKVLEKGLGERLFSKSFSPKSKKFLVGGGRGKPFFKKGSPYKRKKKGGLWLDRGGVFFFIFFGEPFWGSLRFLF